MGSPGGFEMSVGLPVAQARPSSGLVRRRAGVHEMVDILAITEYSGARHYRVQSSLFKIVGKQPPCCVRCQSCRFSGLSYHRGFIIAGVGRSVRRVVQSFQYSRDRSNVYRRYRAR